MLPGRHGSSALRPAPRLASRHDGRRALVRPVRPRVRRHLGRGAPRPRGVLVRPDALGLGGAAVRAGGRGAQGPPVPAGQRPLAGAERRPLRPVRHLVGRDAAQPRGRGPPAAAPAAGPGLPQPGDRGDAPAVPGARGRAGRRLRPARRGRADLAVRRAVRVAHPLRAARPARGALGPGGALGRRPREVVRHQPARRPAPDRGRPGGTHRVRRRRRPRPAREPAGRPRHHARARPQRRDPHRARALGRAGVPRVRGDGDHAQPDRPGAADASCATPTSGRCSPSGPSSAPPPSRR